MSENEALNESIQTTFAAYRDAHEQVIAQIDKSTYMYVIANRFKSDMIDYFHIFFMELVLFSQY